MLKGAFKHARLQTKFSKREEKSFGVSLRWKSHIAAVAGSAGWPHQDGAILSSIHAIVLEGPHPVEPTDRSQPVVVTRHDLLNAGDLGQWLPAHARVVPIKRPAYCLCVLVKYILMTMSHFYIVFKIPEVRSQK